MNYKEYLENLLNPDEETSTVLDEKLVRKYKIRTKNGVAQKVFDWEETDPNYELVKDKDGNILYRKRITSAERAHREQSQKAAAHVGGRVGSKRVKLQKQSIKKHMDLLDGYDKENPDYVTKRKLGQRVKSDEKAANKAKQNNKSGQSGPQQIWNG